jgi:WD40 repeat protein
VVLPSLAHCTEYSHDANPTAACVTGDATSDVEITDVAFTPDGKLLFSAGEDGRVKVWTWDGATLASDTEVLTTTGGFTSLSVSPDNKLIAAGAITGQLTIWNIIATWQVAAQLTGISNDLNGIAFAPDNTLYAVDDNRSFFVYTSANVAPKSSMVLRTFPFIVATSPTVSNGSYWVAIGYEDGDASLINVNLGVLSAEIPFTVSPGISGVYALKFSFDGKLVASGTADGSFGIWNVPAAGSTATPTPASPAIAITTDFVWNAAFHPSNAYIAIADGSAVTNRRLGIWNVATGALQASVPLTSLTYQPRVVTFSPNGRALVVGEHNCGKILVCVDP